MSFLSAAKWRRLVPAGAVAAVLAISYLAPLPSEASNGGFGYNCGVKGYGYHDHGKACPNRPFPGRGIGLAKFGISIATSGGEDDKTTTSTDDKTTTSTDNENTTASQGTAGTAAGTGHGHSQDHPRGKRALENT